LNHKPILFLDPEENLPSSSFGRIFSKTLADKSFLSPCYDILTQIPSNRIETKGLFVFLPANGLERILDLAVQTANRNFTHFYYVMSENDLVNDRRSGPGFRDIIRQVENQFGQLVYLVPPGDDKWSEIENLLLLQMLQAIRSSLTSKLIESLNVDGMVQLTLRKLSNSSSNGSALGLKKVFILRKLQNQVSRVAQSIDSYQRTGEAASAEGLRTANYLITECSKRQLDAEYYGLSVDKVVGELFEKYKNLQKAVDNCELPPSESLKYWRENSLSLMQTPSYNMPLIGMFSSGKTSFFNSFLGSTPAGNPLFRTARTHNTALLGIFRFAEKGANRVEFTYRRDIEYELIWPGTERISGVLSPVTGIIESIELLTDRSQNVKIRDSKSDNLHSIIINPGVQLDVKIRKGASVTKNQQIIKTSKLEVMLRKATKANPGFQICIKSKMIHELYHLYREGIVSHCKLELLNRELDEELLSEENIQSYRVRQRSISQDQTGFDLLFSNALNLTVQDHVSGSLPETRVINIPQETAPIKLVFKGQVNTQHPSLVDQHPLCKEEDWNWFQGSAGETPGFAESGIAAYLIENADIYLNNPLFQLLTMVDTPGLGSITEMHDRITEEYTHRGEGFLIFANLGKGAFQAITYRILTLVSDVLKEKSIPRDQWHERLYIVLNRDARQQGARNEESVLKNIQEFKRTMEHALGSSKFRLYVVDLAPGKLADGDYALEMYGEFSLEQLLLDLRRAVGAGIIDGKISRVIEDFKSTWYREATNLENQLKMLKSDQIMGEIDSINQALDYFADGSTFSNGVKQLIEDNLHDLASIVDRCQAQLNNIEKVDDLATFADTGPSLLAAANSRRNEMIEQLSDELQAQAKRGLTGSGIQVPTEFEISDLIHRIPVFATQEFRDNIHGYLENWPTKWYQFLKRWFGQYAKNTRESLLESFLGEKRIEELDTVLSAVENEILSHCQEICNSATNALRERLDILQSDRKTKQDQIGIISTRLEKMSKHEKTRDELIGILEQGASDISKLIEARK